jgi:arginyl-tRNA synthetase
VLTRSLPGSPITTDPITALRAAIADAASSLGNGASASPKLERPPRADFGDYSTNAAMLLAPALGEPPRPVAERLGGLVGQSLAESVERVDVAGPGFLNLFMTDDWYRRAVGGLFAAGDEFGAGRAEPAERVLVEFVSANPTGPITVASGRHAAYGDSLARILEFAGHDVEREFYVNDHGSQIQRFGESIRARARGEEPPEDGYKGDYVTELAQRIPNAAEGDLEEVTLAGVALMLEDVSRTLERFRVKMDRFFSERSLYASGETEKALALLEARGHLYESEGATWLRTTTFGDDKDRVVRRSTGDAAYFGPDIAYHENKRERGYDRAIDVLGADHHGYVARVTAAWQALGADPDRFEVILIQLVNLIDGGQRGKMSKRQGEFVSLDELVDDIGVDVARFFLLQRSHDTTLDLDLALAREQSDQNPVYYVQYAHARIASILRSASAEPDPEAASGPLHPSEKLLVKRLLEFPSEIDIAVERRAPHRMTGYALELARDFSAFYRDCKVVGVPEEPFRLALALVTQRVIARSLDLLGVSAPDKM